MADKLTPPPPPESARFYDWLLRFYRLVMDGATSSGGDAATQNHAELTSLNTASYTHLTATQANGLTSQGDSQLHFHSGDRDRSSHTGTQTASTISDFTSAVQALQQQSNGVLEGQVFGP